MATTTTDLNLRPSAGTGNTPILTIPSGASVTVTGDPWYPVEYGGKTGWVSGKYLDLTATGPALTTAQQRFPTVASKYLGCWYKWGGNGPDRFDCSGYSWWVMGDMGFVTGRTKTGANNQMHQFRDGRLKGTKVTGALMPGDIMFFGSDKNKATHVAFALGDGTLIGANGGSATTKTLEQAKARNAKVRIDPVNYRKDLIEVWRPAY